MNSSQIIRSLVATLLVFSLAGCDSFAPRDTTLEKKPRPVEVETLLTTTRDSASLVTAPVASWKTEELAMEVSGRIIRVAEPNTDVEPRDASKYAEFTENGTQLQANENAVQNSNNESDFAIDGIQIEIDDEELSVVIKDVEQEKKEPIDDLIDKNVVAEIDNRKYRLQFESRRAEVRRFQQALNAAKVEPKVLDAQLDAAKAELARARAEKDRSERLGNNALSKSEMERDNAAFATAEAEVLRIEAKMKAQDSEIRSIWAQLLQAVEALKDAQRDLNNCKLYSSFPGQISATSVVPGSFVNSGQAVATIQMMTPIKIEIEVSAQDSRRLRNRQRLAVYARNPNFGSESEPSRLDADEKESEVSHAATNDPQIVKKETAEKALDGFLYLVDSVADPQTRTFTLTLLAFNEKLLGSSNEPDLPTVDQTWLVSFPFLPGGVDVTYASQDAILNDANGYYVYRVKNLNVGGQLPKDRILEVERADIRLGKRLVPFLGNWKFQEIQFIDSDFDPQDNLIAAKLRFKGEANLEDWQSKGENKILFQRPGQWLLRPGDLVQVDLSDVESRQGLFVPMDAVLYEDEKRYLFLINRGSGEETATVSKVEVDINIDGKENTAVVQVVPKEGQRLEGEEYVTRGAHYLRDGDKVRPIEKESLLIDSSNNQKNDGTDSEVGQ